MSSVEMKKTIQQVQAEIQRTKQMINMLEENLEAAKVQYQSLIGQATGLNHSLEIVTKLENELVEKQKELDNVKTNIEVEE